MAVWGSWGLAKMPVHLSALPRSRQEHSATALGRLQGQLVKGEDLTPSLEDATSGPAAHLQCTHLQFGHIENPHVICDRPYNHSRLVFSARKLHLSDHPGQGQRWPVGATHE